MPLADAQARVSVLFNESKLPKFPGGAAGMLGIDVSVLFHESKLPKLKKKRNPRPAARRFSTLQRVEIAEILRAGVSCGNLSKFQYSSTSRNCRNPVPFADRMTTMFVSVLFNESKLPKSVHFASISARQSVSVLFNESKLPKSMGRGASAGTRPSFSTLQRVEIAEILIRRGGLRQREPSFSTLQRVEIAEIVPRGRRQPQRHRFQYSSTSRNCRNLT